MTYEVVTWPKAQEFAILLREEFIKRGYINE